MNNKILKNNHEKQQDWMNKLDDYIKTLPNATTSFNNSNIQIREINNHWGSNY